MERERTRDQEVREAMEQEVASLAKKLTDEHLKWLLISAIELRKAEY